MVFLLKSYSVHVKGFAPSIYEAASPGKARAKAWGSYRSYRDISFKEFMRISRVKSADDREGFGRPIKVSGEAAYFVGHNGQYVRFVRPDSDVVLLSHPLDVEGAP